MGLTAVPESPAAIIQLQKVTKRDPRELIVNAWLACAPVKLARDYVDANPALKR